jgi:hypothetical protein
MLVSTVLNLIVIPGLYVILKSSLEFFTRKKPKVGAIAEPAKM